jgi:hypothetical protein
MTPWNSVVAGHLLDLVGSLSQRADELARLVLLAVSPQGWRRSRR